jgi:putative ABC transport system permease protein
MEHLQKDLAYALRYFARTPFMSLTIVLTLAIGIGFSSAVFSIINGVFTRPAPSVPDDPALVKIRGMSNVAPIARRISYRELGEYAKRTETFASVAGWAPADVIIETGDREHGSLSANAHFVTPNFFATLGVLPAIGRGFGQSRWNEMDPPELTAVLSHGFARELFADPDSAVGRRVRVNDVEVTVVGVAPARFNGPMQSGEPRRIWVPMSAWPLLENNVRQLFTDLTPRFEAFARLRPGLDAAAATPVVRSIAARFDAEAKARRAESGAPDSPQRSATADVVRLRGIIDPSRYAVERGPLAVVFSLLAVLILLVCTTTVNSLLVGGAVTRRYEVGVRLALGASRVRIVRQLLTEVSILAVAGGALGMWVFSVLAGLTEIARDGFDVSPAWGTMVFTFGYALIAATIAGLTPALHATRAGLAEVLKDSSAGATGKSKLQRSFVVAQIAIAQPLMVILAAATASILAEIPDLTNVTARERILLAEFDTQLRYTRGTPDQMPTLAQRLREQRGVAAVLQLGHAEYGATLEAPELAGAQPDSLRVPIRAVVYDVPPGYFETLDVPLVRGRDFIPNDTVAGTRSVIINRELAAQLFGAESPLGRRVRWLSPYREATEVEVVGVVDMTEQTTTLEHPPDQPPMFVPFKPRGQGRLLVRTTGPADAMIPTIQSLARADARLTPLRKIGTLAQADRTRRESRIELFGVGALLGGIVLAFAAVGLYAMLSLALEQRRREIGIRVALGARVGEVVGMFFRNGLRVTLVGLAFGLPLSLAGLAAFASGGALPWSSVPITAGIVTLAVMAVAALASWLPARRAAGVDPMIALRTE